MKEIEITLGHATQILNNLTRDKYSEEQIAKSTKEISELLVAGTAQVGPAIFKLKGHPANET